ncbi:EamA family transporter [Clostridium tarantellae]|uniref:EamA family transporter n=1 Tax=Clostridium tarantellae TaxID=39493 RepID=A0A6I1MGD0_9CLOT|nr:EamA family transporter [Clostridium tarantellae]MPQ42586.1 EamA family transporter [Clostridium tarantellae]
MHSIYIIFPLMTFIGSLGGFFFKKGAEYLIDIKSLFLNWRLYIGGILYVTAALLNIFVLKFLPYSIVVPLTAMTYIWTMIISKIMLKEKINLNKIIGVILITIGSIFIAI